MQADNKYINEIWALHLRTADARVGMGGYGVAWEIQRQYYQKLSGQEKRNYEQAVLLLCESGDIKKAKLALGICHQLENVFSDDWAMKVTPIVEELFEKGLQPAYTNTVTYSVLQLVWEFNIRSVLPLVKEFRQQVTNKLKEGALSEREWEPLYVAVSRILIKVSPEDFWQEFAAFHQDQQLLHLLGTKSGTVINWWISFGGLIYGLDWLSKMASEYYACNDQKLKAQALSSIEKSSRNVLLKDLSEREAVKTFLESAKKQLSDVDHSS